MTLFGNPTLSFDDGAHLRVMLRRGRRLAWKSTEFVVAALSNLLRRGSAGRGSRNPRAELIEKTRLSRLCIYETSRIL